MFARSDIGMMFTNRPPTVMQRILSVSVNLSMRKTFKFTAVIEREGDGYVSSCPELDIASQGETLEIATENLKEVVGLFFESASHQEIVERASWV